MKKILFASSEVHPLIKTGGLADVAGSLPRALAELGQDIRIVLPNYQSLKKTEDVRFISTVTVNHIDSNILETQLPGSNVIVWLVDCPALFNTPGNPYVDESGNPWDNIADRFSLFCRVIVEIAMDRGHLTWRPDVVHCNDWQTGLVPALLSLESNAPSSLFTIHNMAYQGMFPATTFNTLNLPLQLWHHDGLEFHEMLSFIKGGLSYANRITTVSPTYALEIQTPEFGYGLEGLLSHKHKVLSGIINGMDLDQWNPETDTAISEPYSVKTLANKMEYILTTIQKWGKPLEKAGFIVKLPSKFELKFLSYEYDEKKEINNYYIYKIYKEKFMPKENRKFFNLEFTHLKVVRHIKLLVKEPHIDNGYQGEHQKGQ